jgi:hypothetical protein
MFVSADFEGRRQIGLTPQQAVTRRGWAWKVRAKFRPFVRIGARKAFRDFSVTIVLTAIPSSALATDVQYGPQLPLVDALRDHNSLQDLRDRLHGSLQITMGDDRLIKPTSFVVALIRNAAKNCGLTVETTHDANADHYLWLWPIVDLTEDSVASTLAQVVNRVNRPYRAENHEFAKEILAQIAANGFSMPILTIDNTYKPQDATIVFWNAANLAGGNSEAVMDFGIFSGLAGFSTQPDIVGNNQFSYLYGGGNIDELAGSDESRFEKLCSALPVVKAICDGLVSESSNSVDLESDMSDIQSKCQPGSIPVKTLIHIESLSSGGGK